MHQKQMQGDQNSVYLSTRRADLETFIPTQIFPVNAAFAGAKAQMSVS